MILIMMIMYASDSDEENINPHNHNDDMYASDNYDENHLPRLSALHLRPVVPTTPATGSLNWKRS